MTELVIELAGVSKHYPTFTFGPLDLQIEQGTAVALIGANGSGKSTLFRLMLNLVQAEQGAISLFGEKIFTKEIEHKQRIGYVGEQYAIFGHLAIKELAELVAHWYPTWDNKRYTELLNRYQLDERKKFVQCSRGTQKKVEFIFSLAHDPDLLLLDEPSAGVDIPSQRKMKEDLIGYMESGEKSIILATHMVDEVKHLCDYICILDQGQLIQLLPKDELQENWARLWISSITENLKNHPNVLEFSQHPAQIITNNLENMETELAKEGLTITHLHRLELDEIMEYLMENN